MRYSIIIENRVICKIMLSGRLHPAIYMRLRGGKNTWDEKSPDKFWKTVGEIPGQPAAIAVETGESMARLSVHYG
jgi:hypothetical protein